MLCMLTVRHLKPGSDEAFLDHLYIPGIRRAGDVETALGMTHAAMHVQHERLTPAAVIEQLRK